MRRETREELGVDLAVIRPLGQVTPNTGLLAPFVSIWRVDLVSAPVFTDESREEGVAAPVTMTTDELKQAIRTGNMHPHVATLQTQKSTQADVLTPAHLLALAYLPEDDFLVLRTRFCGGADPIAVVRQLEKEPFWLAHRRAFLLRCAPLTRIKLS